ncbi:hypothetical protein INT47_003923, partial [Mucor saturninus]
MSMEYMDIDGPEFLSSVNQEIASIRANRTNDTAYQHQLSESTQTEPYAVYNEICVLDTNFLISKLGYLDTVLSIAEQHPGSLLVILPWVVIRELDGLKSSRHGGAEEDEICGRARRAMRFIEHKLRDKCPSLRGQKMKEILDPHMAKTNQKGDDRILDCCMYFHHHTKAKVTLLSNDRNLCIKVMVHDIDSISAESVPKMEALLNRIVSTKVTEDYVMEIDDFYPPIQQPEEDYDMMLDDDHHDILFLEGGGGSEQSRWAKEPTARKSSFKKLPDPPAYLDNDPTLVAPKKPPQNTTYSN